MKKIIEGKAYNTETARLLAGDYYGNGGYEAYSEELYVTKKGQYFIHGEGGPLSKYSKVVGRGQYSGTSIIELVDEDYAKVFIEEHGSAELYEELFSVLEG